MPLYQPLVPVAPGYDPGTFTLDDAHYWLQYQHLLISGSNRLTLTGTAELFVDDFGAQQVLIMGQPKSGAFSFTVPDGWVHDTPIRLQLANTTRATLIGTSDLIVDDNFASRYRIVLAG